MYDITAIAWAEPFVVAGTDEGPIYVWDRKKGNSQPTILNGHTDKVNSVDMRGKMVVSGSKDATVRVWELDKGNRTLKWHTKSVTCVKMCHDVIVSGSKDGTVHTWNLATGAPLHTLYCSPSPVKALAFDQDVLVVATKSQTLLMTPGGTICRTINTQNTLTSIAFKKTTLITAENYQVTVYTFSHSGVKRKT